MKRKIDYWREGARDGVPIGLGYLAVSFTFGIAAKNAGLTAAQATVMSMSNLTSAGQFAALGLITTGAPYLEVALTQLIINLRYCLMSFALSQKLPQSTPVGHRMLVAFGVSDEIFAVSAGYAGVLSPFYNYGLMTIGIFGWTLGTCLGVITGNILPARLLSAASVALYGMFIAVVIPPARTSKVLAGLVGISMLVSAGVSAAPVLRGISPGIRIVLLTLLLSGAAAVLFPIREEAGNG
jgi:Predicted branched-chain amino acid permease (azaleucine resistance)